MVAWHIYVFVPICQYIATHSLNNWQIHTASKCLSMIQCRFHSHCPRIASLHLIIDMADLKRFCCFNDNWISTTITQIRGTNTLWPRYEKERRHQRNAFGHHQYSGCRLVYFPLGSCQVHKICELRMRREWRECFPHHRVVEIPTCITTRAWRKCRDACQHR